jgi:hypothetical protein
MQNDIGSSHMDRIKEMIAMRNAKARQAPRGDNLLIEVDDGRVISHCECLKVRQERDPLSGRCSSTIDLQVLPLASAIGPHQICKVTSAPGYTDHPGDWSPIMAYDQGDLFITLRKSQLCLN